MQRPSAGKTDFVNAGADRRFDILALPGSGITLPLAPFRNHPSSPRNARALQHFSSISRSGALFARQFERLVATIVPAIAPASRPQDMPMALLHCKSAHRKAAGALAARLPVPGCQSPLHHEIAFAPTNRFRLR